MSFVCDDHEFSCRINDEASICTAELLAIEAAIEYIWDSSDEEFMIITDSLSSLQALKSQKLNNPIVSNILHMCHYLSGHKDIIFCWVPSHIGIQGNERADVLAKAALDKTKQFYYIPYTDFKYNISVYLDDILQGEWNINVTSKLFEVQPIIKRSFTPMERRRDDVFLMQGQNWPCLFHKRLFIERRIATYVLQYSSHCKTCPSQLCEICAHQKEVFCI